MSYKIILADGGREDLAVFVISGRNHSNMIFVLIANSERKLTELLAKIVKKRKRSKHYEERMHGCLRCDNRCYATWIGEIKLAQKLN